MAAQPATGVASFNHAWKRWLAEALIVRVPTDQLIHQMVLGGFDRESATAEISKCESSPEVEAGRLIVQRQRKQNVLFKAMAETARQSNYGQEPAKKTLTPGAFYQQYFWRNWPVVLQGLIADWPALERWTLDYFAQRYGAQVIEITSEREDDQLFEMNLDQHRSRIKMRDFIRRIQECDHATNDFYLVAKNGLLSNSAFRDLLEDIPCPHGLLDPGTADCQNIGLWFGPTGTVTPLHHDGSNILLAQVRGRKLVKLISPFFLGELYNTHECFSDVDLELIDYQKFPLMKNVEILTVTLEPGELLFIPIGWWHWVKALEVSISVSFQNFLFPHKPILLEA